MSVWFKLDQAPSVADEDMYIIQFYDNAFYCYVTRQMGVYCRSDKGSSAVMQGDLRVGQWYVLLIQSQAERSNFYVRTIANQTIGEDSFSQYFPFGYTSLSFSEIYIGIRSN